LSITNYRGKDGHKKQKKLAITFTGVTANKRKKHCDYHTGVTANNKRKKHCDYLYRGNNEQ